ncbi:Transcriptional regulator, LacI family [Marinilactibacillus psychrotolerans 42ea]|uniref:Transcriptional regulator, LacI family n=1 Tax=Marinilactibacillus psychrotolerans 42ea TaxID=1255609 RepID=A0A1R4J560_9LACT|nr:LacI family DNA-binding transcriptional regulator [Marinilactibacillus psychrotolerans]SJN27226.1 Transcriptional regulator, LacI family [Marinilactibacillus psychrotolerans 42ea]
MNNRIMIRDVAKEANVSIATVSKALNGVDVVKPATKKKILETAERLHYVPNFMGKQLKKVKTNTLGFYTTSISGPYFSVLVESIAREAEKHGYSLNVFISADKKVVLNSILGGMVDGMIGFEDLLNHDDLEAIKREHIKAVFIDRNIQDQSFGSVVFDSFDKGKEATEYLLSLGYEKVAFVTGIEGVYDSDERYKGYRAALEDANISFDKELIIEGFFEETVAYTAVINFLRKFPGKMPIAFLAGNDLSAIGTVKAIKESGYSVPEDFSVIGFDGIDLLNYFTPSLSTVKNPISKQGIMAVNHLIDLINEKNTGQSFVLKGKLIVNQSTRII